MTFTMTREIIQPEGMWDPRPRFAHVAKKGPFVYVAGQTAVDENGNLVGKGDIEAQTRQVMENIKKCLAAAGATLEDVVKINVYCTDLANHAPVISAVRREYFGDKPVPSTTVQVPRLVNPDWLVEIEAIAILDE